MKNILKFNNKKIIYILAIAIFIGIISLMSLNKKEDMIKTYENKIDLSAKESMHPVELTDEELNMFDIIYKDFVYGSYNLAAIDIINSYSILDGLLNEKLSDGKYIYDGKEVKKLDINYSGQGLVFLGSSMAYFGEFSNGMPNGKIYGIFAYEADAKRYDYINAEFKAGKANGYGDTGYIYLNTSGDNEVLSVHRIGEFKEDLLNGTIRYELKDDKGAEDIWEIDVKDGVIVLNDKWSFDEEKKIYRIKSSNQTENEIEINQEDINKERFKNSILWDAK